MLPSLLLGDSLVIRGAALPLAGVVHAGRADGAGDDVGGAG